LATDLDGSALDNSATVKKMLSNIVANPDEDKFRSINLNNDAFKKRVSSLVGGVALFKASGFTKNVAAGKLELDATDVDTDRIQQVLTKIEAAIPTA